MLLWENGNELLLVLFPFDLQGSVTICQWCVYLKASLFFWIIIWGVNMPIGCVLKPFSFSDV